MQKIIFNYKTINDEERRLELYRDTQITEEAIYSLLYLHSQGLIHLDNALPILELYNERD